MADEGVPSNGSPLSFTVSRTEHVISIHFSTLPSTQIWCEEHIQDLYRKYGSKQHQCIRVTADEQTAGIGQRILKVNSGMTSGGSRMACVGRSVFPVAKPEFSSQPKTDPRHHSRWVSSSGNIFATYVFFGDTQFPLEELAHCPKVAALAIINALQRLGYTPQYKWVNDVVIGGKKIAGILCSSRYVSPETEHNAQNSTKSEAVGSAAMCVLIGVGLNLYPVQTAVENELPRADWQSTTSLFEVSEAGAGSDRWCQQGLDKGRAQVPDALSLITQSLLKSVRSWLVNPGFSRRVCAELNTVLYKKGELIEFDLFEEDDVCHDGESQRRSSPSIRKGRLLGLDAESGGLRIHVLKTLNPSQNSNCCSIQTFTHLRLLK